jgi:hypothetical protein
MSSKKGDKYTNSWYPTNEKQNYCELMYNLGVDYIKNISGLSRPRDLKCWACQGEITSTQGYYYASNIEGLYSHKFARCKTQIQKNAELVAVDGKQGAPESRL